MPLYSGSAQGRERRKIFENKQLAGRRVLGSWYLVVGQEAKGTTRFEAGKTRKREVDSLSTGLSNWG